MAATSSASRGPLVTMREAPFNLADLSRTQAIRWPAQVALTFEGKHTTYVALDARATQVANGLRAIASGPGTRVAVLAKNADQFFELLFGAAKAGQVLVPVNWRLAPAEAAYILNDAVAEVLFVSEEFFPLVTQIQAALPALRQVIACSGQHPEWESYTTWRERQDATDSAVAVTGSDVVVQLYTSGTTGHPKGVQLTHANLLVALAGSDEYYPCTPADVSLVCFPQFHVAGVMFGLIGLYMGARTLITREPVPAEILRLIPAERVTITGFVPAVILFLLQTPGCQQTDFSSLRRIGYGAAPIPLDLLTSAMATFQCAFVHVYGMTEAPGAVSVLSPEDHLLDSGPRLRSCGKPSATLSGLRIVDRAGLDVPTGEVGEIVLRSEQVMLGYWNQPEATASAIQDGWFHTGDAGYLDADGYLYLHDRIKDLIISGGENIYPAEVESALFGHPAVADVGVIGVPDARWGEAVKAVVVRQPDASVTEAELIAYCRERIAHYKAPKSVDFTDALPRNASGKILKRELRAPYWADRERQVN
jgi:long-chain acyl-CoA synthetase